jgi:hypothetical protein
VTKPGATWRINALLVRVMAVAAQKILRQAHQPITIQYKYTAQLSNITEGGAARLDVDAGNKLMPTRLWTTEEEDAREPRSSGRHSDWCVA